jgi:alpha-amylase/alpha-mannosidase (GH57 family)
MQAKEHKPLNVVLMWHMHQPEYRDLSNGEYHLPWTYLHAIKDYVDMVAHLESCPTGRAVVNFAPVLLEQLEDYGAQIDAYFATGKPVRDQLLHSLVSDEDYRSDTQHRRWLIEACLKANEEHLINRYPVFQKLIHTAKRHIKQGSLKYLYSQFFIDLTVWYHLAWMGETIKHDNLIVRNLIQKGSEFSPQDRDNLMRVIGEQIRSIIPRYRQLAEDGRIELCMSPYSHPMLPLLLDFSSALDATPDLPLPAASHYPGGEARANWHMEHGIRVFERCFGQQPVGCWPSEGGVSEAAADLIAQHGFRWLATGDTVLHNSFREQPSELLAQCRHADFLKNNTDLHVFFRDDGLSDLIGFTYSKWHADDAVADLIQHLHNIHTHCDDKNQTVVSIILDGENAWEHFPENGYHFLQGLYQRLSNDPKINLTTYSDYLAGSDKSRNLPRLAAGSWVYGNFATWMGDADKNRAWDLLCNAKIAFDEYIRANPDMAEDKALLAQLAICEGSDWFWWFGDYNPAGSVQDFDQLYRKNLSNLYQLIEQPVPEALSLSLSQGNANSTAETGGVMRRGS